MQKRRIGVLSVLSIVVLILAACSASSATPPTSFESPVAPSGSPAAPGETPMALSGSPTAPSGTPGAPGLPETGGGPAMINVGQSDQLGQFLTDGQGRTLYVFMQDSPNTSTCADQCAENWPPLTTTGDPVAGVGVDASLLGTTARSDGGLQVTYNQMPLYYSAKDTAPGDTNGQGASGAWYVISPTGEAVQQ
jgi:predicted lipoprotein with Yx(FWY)xxD motif